MRVVESLNRSLHQILESDPKVVLLGEDLLDPYGGAFKVCKGLSTKYPKRVMSTPISEAAIVGVANGLALRGWKPVVEIMFGDFLSLVMDQMLNGMAKFQSMFGDRAALPIVVRTPMGGGRGYGPTHSQSIEKHFLGIPGVKVVAISRAHDAGELLRRAVCEEGHPTLFIENKLLYGQESLADDPGPWSLREGSGRFPTTALSLNDFESADAVLITYGGMLPACLEAAYELAWEHELFCQVVVPSLLNPVPLDDFAEIVHQTGRLVVVEEGTPGAGFGAEVLARLLESASGNSALIARRVTATDSIIPASRTLEDMVLPSAQSIRAALLAVLGQESELTPKTPR